MDTLNPATLLSGRFKQEQIPDLSDRVALVTGGSAGIGYHDALGLARAGARVIILSATPEHGLQAEKEMNEFLTKNPGGNTKGSVKWYGIDFGDLKALDKLAKELATTEKRLDILINNAGVGQGPYGLTKDGVENRFGVNNLASYVLTLRLLPLMQKTAARATPGSVRIVMQSSEMHRLAPSDTKFSSLEEINEKRDPSVAYGRSKLAFILLARQLVKRKLQPNEPSIIITSCHPGTVDTDLQNAWTQSYGTPGKILEYLTRLVAKSAPEGAEASLWLATSPDVGKDHQGNYYSEANGKPGVESSQAQDEALGDAFWALCQKESERILGEDVN